MTNKATIHTDLAPAVVGTYSQAIKVNNTVYLSGQIPLDPTTKTLVKGPIAVQMRRVFENLRAVCEAAGGDLSNLVKLNIYLVDLANFSSISTVMEEYFSQPYPARAAIGVKQLPLGAEVEMDGVMVI